MLFLDLRCRFLIVVNLGLSLIKKSFISVFGFQGTNKTYTSGFLPMNGDGEIRTLDPLLARQVLSQLSYTPTDVRDKFVIEVGLSGLEPPTSRLSGVRSNRLSYKPIFN